MKLYDRATTDIGSFMPHQGRYMIEDLMKRCTIEYNSMELYTGAITYKPSGSRK